MFLITTQFYRLEFSNWLDQWSLLTTVCPCVKAA